MNKFTPGKWKYFDLYGIIGTDTDGIARVYHAGKETLTAEGQTNARLIAAAPELYELVMDELRGETGGILSFDREAKIKAVLNRIDGKEENTAHAGTE